jgi:hypothetical protein
LLDVGYATLSASFNSLGLALSLVYIANALGR